MKSVSRRLHAASFGPLALAGVLAWPACAQPSGAVPSTSPTVWVYQPAGGRQCAEGGVPLAQHQAALKAAGVAVTAARCASDGRMRVAMCGAADGRLNVFEVPVAAVAAAQKAGFLLLKNLPDAQFTDCR